MQTDADRSSQDQQHNFDWNQRMLLWASRLLSAVMIACLMVPVVLIGWNIFAGWEGWYLIPLVFIVALESMYSHYRTRHLSIFSLEWWFSRTAEIVVLLVLVKVLLSGLHGFEHVYTDLALWQEDFLRNFFDVEYSLVAFIVVGIWVFSGDLDRTFVRIEGDQKLLAVEFDTGYSEQRQTVRQGLANLIIFCGGIMVVLVAVLNFNSQNTSSHIQVGIIAVLVYFVCGLVLLSITQYSILRVRWVIYQVPVETKITSRWYLFSLLLISLLGVFAIFLPTAYSSQLLGFLQWVFAVFLNLVATIVYFLLLPFVLFMGWVMSLFKRNSTVELPIRPEMPPLPQPVLSQSAPWFTIVKTIIFWSVLCGFVIFAFYYYLREHPEYFTWLSKRRFNLYIKRILDKVLKWIWGINSRVGEVIQSGIKRLVSTGSDNADTVVNRKFTNPKRMSPRQQVIFYYLGVLKRADELGISRRASQTPKEYAAGLEAYLANKSNDEISGDKDQALGLSRQSGGQEITPGDIHKITAEFMEARYSEHPITPSQASLARNTWERILRLFRRLKSQD